MLKNQDPNYETKQSLQYVRRTEMDSRIAAAKRDAQWTSLFIGIVIGICLTQMLRAIMTKLGV